MSVKPKKDLVVRSAILASLVLASGVISFDASACDTRDVYNQKISGLLDKYNNEIVKANDAYARENTAAVKVVYTDGRHFPREYFPGYFYTDAGLRYQNWEAWKAAVNAAVSNYSNEAKTAYNNACLFW
jgi:hypothetical protein